MATIEPRLVRDDDRNVLRMVFFIIGFMTGLMCATFIFTHDVATKEKLLYNRCSDHVKQCWPNGPVGADSN